MDSYPLTIVQGRCLLDASLIGCTQCGEVTVRSEGDRLNVAVEGDLAPLVHENARVVEGIARVTLVPGLEGRTLSAVEAGVTVRAPLEGTVDVGEWLARQRKRLAEFDKQIRQAQGKLGNEGFVARAPAEVIEEERRRLADFGAQKERLEQVLAQFA